MELIGNEDVMNSVCTKVFTVWNNEKEHTLHTLKVFQKSIQKTQPYPGWQNMERGLSEKQH